MADISNMCKQTCHLRQFTRWQEATKRTSNGRVTGDSQYSTIHCNVSQSLKQNTKNIYTWIGVLAWLNQTSSHHSRDVYAEGGRVHAGEHKGICCQILKFPERFIIAAGDSKAWVESDTPQPHTRYRAIVGWQWYIHASHVTAVIVRLIGSGKREVFHSSFSHQ